MQLNNSKFLNNLMDYRGFSGEAMDYVWVFMLEGKYSFNYPKGYSTKDIYETIKETGVIYLKNDYLTAVIDLDSLLRESIMRYPGVLRQFTITEFYDGHKKAVTLFQDLEQGNRIESIVEKTERSSKGILINSFYQKSDANESIATVFYKNKEDIKGNGLNPSTLLSYAQLGGRERDFNESFNSTDELFPHKILGKKTVSRKGKDFLYDQLTTCAEEFKRDILSYMKK